jgi:hypothetical protein
MCFQECIHCLKCFVQHCKVVAHWWTPCLTTSSLLLLEYTLPDSYYLTCLWTTCPGQCKPFTMLVWPWILPDILWHTFEGQTNFSIPCLLPAILQVPYLPIPGNAFVHHAGRSLPVSPGMAIILHFCWWSSSFDAYTFYLCHLFEPHHTPWKLNPIL